MANQETETSGTAKLLTIGSTPIPGINNYSVTLEDIDSENTQRDETGTLHREPLRKNVMKIAITAVIPSEKVEAVSQAISPDTFEAEVYCPMHPDAAGGYVTGTFYISRKTIQLLSFSGGYWTVSFNAVEV